MNAITRVALFAQGMTRSVETAWDRVGERVDGWVNVMTGLGTSRDKTTAARFQANCFLSDPDLAALYSYDDLAGTIVDMFPKQAMRLGFGLSGIDPSLKEDLDRYLQRFDVVNKHIQGRIWGRCFGGGAIWVMVDDGLDPSEPLDPEKIRSVLGLRVIDRRWAIPASAYRDGPNVGNIEIYRLQEPHAMGVGSTIGYVHETRLITYGGALTETLEKIRLKGWDHSVLVKCYEALRASGQTWKAIEVLVSDANQAVLSISNLWSMITADPTQGDASNGDPTGGGALQKRARIFDQTRSVSRVVLLDKENETFERKPTTFTGLSDLSDRAWNRVAAASRIPVQLLVGEAPAGLNATGDVTLRWFLAEVAQEQKQIDEPALLRLLKILLAADDAPDLKPAEDDADVDPFDALGIVWLPLWAPTATELATMRLQRAQESTAWITNQVFRPEEIAMSLPEDWVPFDRELRAQILEDDHETLMSQQIEKEKAQNEAAIAGAERSKETAENPPEPVVVAAPGKPGAPPVAPAGKGPKTPGAPPPNDGKAGKNDKKKGNLK